MRKALTCWGVALLLLFGAVPTAQAAILVDGWKLDVSGIDGIAAATTVSPIRQITFLGFADVNVTDANGSGTFDPGEIASVDGLLRATSFADPFLADITPASYGAAGGTWELTFDFTLDIAATSFALGNLNFTHLAGGAGPSDGLLDIYIDGPTGGLTGASAASLASWTDGVLIATFRILAGEGGVLNFSTLNGADDATFELISALPGVIFDSGGTDLSTLIAGGNPVLLALSDSDFDLNADLDGDITNNIGVAGWPASHVHAGSTTDFIAVEDGSIVLALGVIPEPASVIAWGGSFLLLAGIGVIRRRKRNAVA